ncbi:MAG: dienelactone hydrolase family protein [Polyangiaceae bacterium]|nr:dienelactone hydrolase family protein [Polyangiaceae bacterium]
MLRRASICAFLIAFVALPSGHLAAADESAFSCAPGLSEVGHATCSFDPKLGDKNRTVPLVIFLHGLMPGDEAARHGWQSYVRDIAQHAGFAVLVPSGRLGAGPGRDPNIMAWPTSERARAEHEATVLEDWAKARETFEAERGKKFTKVFVFGFSNGAYYATSLAARARLAVNGYAVFGGGSGASYLRRQAAQVKLKPPMFVGIGKHDGARKDARSLAQMLKRLAWPHRFRESQGGHNVTPAQAKEAVQYLEGAK